MRLFLKYKFQVKVQGFILSYLHKDFYNQIICLIFLLGPSRLDELERSMRNEGFKTGSEIDVVMMPDGRLTSLDNRRLLAARRANVLVKVNLHQYDDLLPTGFNRVYIPPYGERTWGSAIEWRILSQPSVVFRQQYPYGCIDEPYVKGVKGNKKTDKIIEDDSYDWPFHHDEN